MTDISPLAAWTRAIFGNAGVHAVVRTGRTVHAVSLGQRVAGEQAPGSMCHTGVAGWSPDALLPTRAQVTCARCLRRLGVRSRRPSSCRCSANPPIRARRASRAPETAPAS
ncbi:hypothetical protein [Nocardia sp. NPDC050435]|uniref:hypothetical protein n=1 Tax=Nocardia sp. NPDC050435 TaxID=3155040 RepID=UPI00340CCCBC